MVRSGGRVSMSGCVRKDEMGMRMMRVEAECRVVVVAKTGGYGEEEGVLAGMELETIFVLHRS